MVGILPTMLAVKWDEMCGSILARRRFIVAMVGKMPMHERSVMQLRRRTCNLQSMETQEAFGPCALRDDIRFDPAAGAGGFSGMMCGDSARGRSPADCRRIEVRPRCCAGTLLAAHGRTRRRRRGLRSDVMTQKKDEQPQDPQGTPGVVFPGKDMPDKDMPGDDKPGNDKPGNDKPGNDMPGEDEPGKKQGNNTPGDRQGDNAPGAGQGVNRPGGDPGDNRPGEQHDEDRTSHHPDHPAYKPPTSAQQATQEGRSAQPGADADDLDSQDRIPDLRR
jgi:hypothetical protein